MQYRKEEKRSSWVVSYSLYFLFWIIFVAIFYLENSYIRNVSFSHLWKIPLILFLLLYYLLKTRYRPIISNLGILNSIKMLINTNITKNPISNLLEFSRFLTVPLVFNYFVKKKTEVIKVTIVVLSQYIILSSIPIYLKLIEQKGKTVNLTSFGFYNIEGHVGIFQRPHAAAATYSFALICLIYFFIRKKELIIINRLITNNAFNIFLIILGSYNLYKTYVRVGYIMFLASMLVILIKIIKTDKSKSFLRITIIITMISIALIPYFINQVEAIKLRLLDQRLRSFQIGSGRINIWQVSIERWRNGDILEKLIGIGIDNLKYYQEERLGIWVFSHNQFIDSLTQNGILGLFIYLAYIISIFLYIRAKKKNENYLLPLSLFIGYLIFAFFQGSSYFLPDLLFALSLALIKMTK